MDGSSERARNSKEMESGGVVIGEGIKASWLRAWRVENATFGQQTPASRGVHGVPWRAGAQKAVIYTVDVGRSCHPHLHPLSPFQTALPCNKGWIESSVIIGVVVVAMTPVITLSHCHDSIHSMCCLGEFWGSTQLGFRGFWGIIIRAHLFPSMPTRVEIIIIIISGFSKRSAQGAKKGRVGYTAFIGPSVNCFQNCSV